MSSVTSQPTIAANRGDSRLVSSQTQQPPGAAAPRVLLIVPCYNEQESIADLLREIHALGAGYSSVVIDDGSSDATSVVAEPHSPVVRLASNLGIGGAVQTGIKYAFRVGYDFCVQIDGDGQHIPAEIDFLLRSHRECPRNVIIGSRYLAGSGFRSTLTRRLGSRLISSALDCLFKGGRITDPTSGMRLMDRDAMALFSRRYPQDFPEPVSLAWAMRAGLSVGETAVTMRAREKGSSSISGLKPLAYMIRVLSYIVLARLSSMI
jgi:glycosyltransferase involved in cell wall biosynthesis